MASGTFQRQAACCEGDVFYPDPGDLGVRVYGYRDLTCPGCQRQVADGDLVDHRDLARRGSKPLDMGAQNDGMATRWAGHPELTCPPRTTTDPPGRSEPSAAICEEPNRPGLSADQALDIMTP